MAEAGERTVRVSYYAAAVEAAGRTDEDIVLAHGATVGDLKERLVATYGAPMVTVLASASFLADSTISRDDAQVLGSAVDVLPPFAGG